MRVLAVCQERCGFRHVVSTGWLQCTAEQAQKLREQYGPLTRRVVQRANGTYEARVRLRLMACPRCGARGLKRAYSIEEVVGQVAEHARAPLQPPPPNKRRSTLPVFQRSTGWR